MRVDDRPREEISNDFVYHVNRDSVEDFARLWFAEIAVNGGKQRQILTQSLTLDR